MTTDQWLEIVGTTFGLASVVLTVRRKIACWPVGIVSVVAFAVLFFRIKLYADTALQVFFIGTGFYGWWAWKFCGRERGELPIRVLSARQRLVGVVLVVPVIAATGWVLRQFTDAALPWWDATASGLAVCAQLLLMRKVFETWSLWIAVDVLSIGIYFAKGVYLTAALYAVFLSLATMGWLAWRREICAAADPVPLLPWKDRRKTLQA